MRDRVKCETRERENRDRHLHIGCAGLLSFCSEWDAAQSNHLQGSGAPERHTCSALMRNQLRTRPLGVTLAEGSIHFHAAAGCFTMVPDRV